jgi:hypothetical protein
MANRAEQYNDSAPVDYDYPSDGRPRKLFDITAVIGEVYEDPRSGMSPREAAFLQIARYTESAVIGTTFSFPNEDGGVNYITIEQTTPDQEAHKAAQVKPRK